MNYLNNIYFEKNDHLILWKKHIKRYRLQLLLLLPDSLHELFLNPSSIKVSYQDYGAAYDLRITFYYCFESVTFERYVWKEEDDTTDFWNWSISKNGKPIYRFSEQLIVKTKENISKMLLSFGQLFQPSSKEEQIFSKGFSFDEYETWEEEQWYLVMKSYQKQKKKKSYKKIKTNS